MPLLVSSFLVPRNNNTWHILEDTYLKGGLRIANSVADMNSIASTSRKKGMLCVTQNDMKIWQLQADLETWTEYNFTGTAGLPVRQTLQHVTAVIVPTQVYDFVLPMGRAAIVYRLEVDSLCKVQAYSTPLRDETNPYTFVADTDHLVDDGSTKMPDNSIIYGRRYSTLVNLEQSGENIYFSITNTDSTPKTVTMQITFLKIE